jgi:hypothetical protein
MRDEELVHQPDGHYVVVLQDGVQLDGALNRYEHCFSVGPVTFLAHEVDDFLCDEGGWLAPARLPR